MQVARTYKSHDKWIHDDNKVVSINKYGLACSELKLAEFSDNDLNGVQTFNTIDVRQRLQQYKTAFETLRSAAHAATDFESLKSAIVTSLAGV